MLNFRTLHLGWPFFQKPPAPKRSLHETKDMSVDTPAPTHDATLCGSGLSVKGRAIKEFCWALKRPDRPQQKTHGWIGICTGSRVPFPRGSRERMKGDCIRRDTLGPGGYIRRGGLQTPASNWRYMMVNDVHLRGCWREQSLTWNPAIYRWERGRGPNS